MFANKRLIGAFAITITLGFCQLAAGQDTTYIAKDAGKFIRTWGSLGSGNNQLNFRNRLAVGKDGSIYATDVFARRVRKFSATGKFLLKWGSFGISDDLFRSPAGVAIAPDGSVMVVDNQGSGLNGTGRVKRFATSGNFLSAWGVSGNGAGQLFRPDDIAIDTQGNVIVADEGNSRIQVYSLTGTFKKQWTTADKAPDDIAVGPDGSIFLSDTENFRIVRFNQQGNMLNTWGSSGVGPNKFGTPKGLAVTPGGSVYVADSQRKWVQVYRSDGTYITTIGSEGDGNGQFRQPADVAIGKDGSVYVSDNSRYSIQQLKSATIEPTGKTVTLSGTISASTLSANDLKKLTVRVDGRDNAGSKRKFFAEVAVQSDGSFTFDGYPAKGKYKIVVKGFKKSELELSPKKHRGKASKSENDLDFELIAK